MVVVQINGRAFHVRDYANIIVDSSSLRVDGAVQERLQKCHEIVIVGNIGTLQISENDSVKVAIKGKVKGNITINGGTIQLLGDCL